MIEGRLKDFSKLADEVPDRDLILFPPINHVDRAGMKQRLRAHAATVSARDIKTLLVDYSRDPSEPPLASSPDPEGGGSTGGDTSGSKDS